MAEYGVDQMIGSRRGRCGRPNGSLRERCWVRKNAWGLGEGRQGGESGAAGGEGVHELEMSGVGVFRHRQRVNALICFTGLIYDGRMKAAKPVEMSGNGGGIRVCGPKRQKTYQVFG